MLEIIAVYILVVGRGIAIAFAWWAAGKEYEVRYQVKDAVYTTLTGVAIAWLLISAYLR